MNDQNWRDLVRRASGGDGTAFEELYSATKKSVYFICLKMIGNESDAKDAMQNTYLTAYQKLSGLDDGANFQKWVNGIAANKCREMFRVKTDDSLDEKFDNGIEFKDVEFIPEDYVTDRARRKIIMEIIERELTDVQRQTVLLYYYDQMTVPQIAKVMDCTESAVKYRLCTARDKIREAVLIYEKEHDDRLHALMPIPVLTKIFRTEADQISVPDIPLDLATNAVSSSPVNTIAKSAGGNQMKNTVIAKVIAGVAAGTLAVGGLVFALKGNSASEKDIEDKFNSISEQIDKQDSKASGRKAADSEAADSKSSDTKPEDITYEMSDEIKNADFASGLVQIGNEIFKNGGYMTVDQVVAKYSDRYDTSEINPDGLIERNKTYPTVYMTSKEDPSLKISIAISTEYADKGKSNVRIGDCVAGVFSTGKKGACWYPHGITNECEGYNINSLPALLKSLGFKEVTMNDFDNKYYKNYGLFWDYTASGVSEFRLRESGTDVNLYGVHPLMEYSFGYKLDTTECWKTKVRIFLSHYYKKGDLVEFTRIS